MKVFLLTIVLISNSVLSQSDKFDECFVPQTLPYTSTQEFYEIPYFEFKDPKDYDLTLLSSELVINNLGFTTRVYDEYDSEIDKFYGRYKITLGEGLIGYVVYHQVSDTSANPAPTNDFCYREQLFIFKEKKLVYEFNLSRFYAINGKRWFSFSEITTSKKTFTIKRHHVESKDQKSDQQPSRFELFEWNKQGFLHEIGHHNIR